MYPCFMGDGMTTNNDRVRFNGIFAHVQCLTRWLFSQGVDAENPKTFVDNTSFVMLKSQMKM